MSLTHQRKQGAKVGVLRRVLLLDGKPIEFFACTPRMLRMTLNCEAQRLI